MNEKKQKLGYQTPATLLNDKYDEITEKIKGSKIKWTVLEKMISEFAKNSGIQMRKDLEREGNRNVTTSELFMHRNFLITLLFVSKVGQDVIQNQDRLNIIEKDIEELKLIK